SGLIRQGLSRMESLLAAQNIRLPASRRKAIAATLWQRLRLELRGLDFTLRDRPASPAALHRLDVWWGAFVSLSPIDPNLAEPLAVMHLIEAPPLGDRSPLVGAPRTGG